MPVRMQFNYASLIHKLIYIPAVSSMRCSALTNRVPDEKYTHTLSMDARVGSAFPMARDWCRSLVLIYAERIVSIYAI